VSEGKSYTTIACAICVAVQYCTNFQ